MWITGVGSAHFWGFFNVGKAALKEKREEKGEKYEALKSWVSAYMQTRTHMRIDCSIDASLKASRRQGLTGC